MPGHKLTMLPDAVVDAFTLAEGRDAPVVSLYVHVRRDDARDRWRARPGSSACAIAANLRHDQLDERDHRGDARGRPAGRPCRSPRELAFLHGLAQQLKAGASRCAASPRTSTVPTTASGSTLDGRRTRSPATSACRSRRASAARRST